MPILISVLIYLAYNYIRRGNPLYFGYEEERFSEDFIKGFYGLILSPGKGLFIYNPILLLSLLGIRYIIKQKRGRLYLCGYIIVINILFYSKWHNWEGGWTWGPRFLIPTLPFWLYYGGIPLPVILTLSFSLLTIHIVLLLKIYNALSKLDTPVSNIPSSFTSTD